MAICEARKLIPEQVHLLSRMGMSKKALELIVTKLGASTDENGVAFGEKAAVEKAIEFCKEENDSDLWDDLIEHSIDKPDFILGLLNGTGTYLNPLRLIKRIRPGMEIPGLRSALVTILHDFNLQSELRLGCKTILENYSIRLFGGLVKRQRRATRIDPTSQRCPISNELLTEINEREKIYHFQCGQMYTGSAITSIRMKNRDRGGGGGGRGGRLEDDRGGPMLCPCALPCSCRPPPGRGGKGKRGGRR